MFKYDKHYLNINIHLLKSLMGNTVEGTFKEEDITVVNALISGSNNMFNGEIGFEFDNDHIMYLRNAWDTAINNQIDNTVINKLKKV